MKTSNLKPTTESLTPKAQEPKTKTCNLKPEVLKT